MKRGKCELCHALADLRDSHYFPKSGYKRVQQQAGTTRRCVQATRRIRIRSCFEVARLNKLAAGPGLQILRCRHEETRTPGLYRINFEVSHIKLFSSLAFPVSRRTSTPLTKTAEFW
jgi:hypothetical protein